MKCFHLLSLVPLLGTVSITGYSADTLQLADGGLLEGEFIGSSNNIIMFKSGDEIHAFPEADVMAIYFDEGFETAEELAKAPEAATLAVPAGSRLVIRMTDTIDSSRHPAGHKFRAQLESALVVDGVTLAARNTIVYGRIASAQQAGRLVGSSELTIEFTDIMLNDQLFPISTSGLQAQTGNEAGATVRRTAGAAAIGALIDGKSGARTGAKVGAGASILTRGASINIPRGTLLETRLAAPVELPRP